MGLPILMMHMLRTTYLLIPRLPILMALSSSSTATSSAASPPLHFPLQHYDTLGFGPWHGSCRTILITIIVIIMSRQSESAQSSLSPRPLCHHIGRAKVLTPLVMIAKSFIDSQVRGIHSVSPRRLSE